MSLNVYIYGRNSQSIMDNISKYTSTKFKNGQLVTYWITKRNNPAIPNNFLKTLETIIFYDMERKSLPWTFAANHHEMKGINFICDVPVKSTPQLNTFYIEFEKNQLNIWSMNSTCVRSTPDLILSFIEFIVKTMIYGDLVEVQKVNDTQKSNLSNFIEFTNQQATLMDQIEKLKQKSNEIDMKKEELMYYICS